MAGKRDKIKGRVKEAVGVLANNKSLKREGRIDQVVGSVKDAAETVVDKTKDALKRRPKK